MRRIPALICLTLLTFGWTGSYNTGASTSEKTIVLRVKSVESRRASFSGWYQSDENKSPVDVTMRNMVFGIKLQTESLKGSFRAEAGKPDLFIELIEFNGNLETGSVTGQGSALEFDVQSGADGSQMHVRSVR